MSPEVVAPGLVAQGRTLAETLEIARDVAKRLIEAQVERGGVSAVSPLDERFSGIGGTGGIFTSIRGRSWVSH